MEQWRFLLFLGFAGGEKGCNRLEMAYLVISLQSVFSRLFLRERVYGSGEEAGKNCCVG